MSDDLIDRARKVGAALRWMCIGSRIPDLSEMQDAGRTILALLDHHDRRTSELLEANNREVDRRREAERERDEALAKMAALRDRVEAVLRNGYLDVDGFRAALTSTATVAAARDAALRMEVIADAMTALHMDLMEGETAERALRRLIGVEQLTALDPAVSEGAAALVERGWREGIEEAAVYLESLSDYGMRALAESVRALAAPTADGGPR